MKAQISFIWYILHERGQGMATKNVTQPQQAWEFAEEEIRSKYPLLEERIEDFYKHRDER